MKQKHILAALGALAVTGLAIYLIRRKRRSGANEEANHYEVNHLTHMKSRSRAFNKSRAMVFEPDDHPE